MKVLITNTVPLNGGDEALLRAVMESWRGRWPDSRITVLCRDVQRCRRYLPDLELESDLEFAAEAEGGTIQVLTDRVRRVLRPVDRKGRVAGVLRACFPNPGRKRVMNLYRETDVIVSAPGGFLHDHYPIEDRLRGFKVGLNMGKPVVILGQSIGPFWKEESRRRVGEVLNRVSVICVRDAASIEHLTKCGVKPGLIRQTADAAFLWRKLAPELYLARREDEPVRRLGLCFRAWPLHDEEASKEIIKKAIMLVKHLLQEPERRIGFISTCQGIPGYIDDSTLAEEIIIQLSPELRARCEVDGARYGPHELIGALSGYDAFIGMRLHGCLLAMLGGAPAMGLGYEDKTSEIFRQMTMEEFQVHSREGVEAWIRGADHFLGHITDIRRRLPGVLDEMTRRVEGNLDAVAEIMLLQEETPA